MSTARPERLVGCAEPRVFTPPLRELTPDTTLGFEVVEFAEKALGVTLFPWQCWLVQHMLELREDGLFRFRKVVLLVGRQNGKSTLSQVLALYFMYVLGAPKVLGTAQDLGTSEDVWQGALEMAQESESLGPLLARPKLGKGSKEFGFTTGEVYRVRAANRKAGRGLSKVRLVLLDELREHQTWQAWAAITKTTNAEPEAIVFALSNAGDVSSVVLRYLRKMAHKAIGDPDGINAADDPSLLLESAEVNADDIEVQADDSLGIFEWSATPDCDVMDRSGWAQSNPSLPHTITERVLSSDAKTDPEWVFRTECLCQWSDGSLVGPFPPGAWDAGRTGAGSQIVGEVHAALEVSQDRSKTTIVYGGRREDGAIQVEVVAYRAGTDWAVAWLASPERTVAPVSVVVQPSAPAGSLITALVEAGLPVREWAGSDIGQACGQFYDLVRREVLTDELDASSLPGERLVHLPHSVLDVAAATAATAPLVAGTWVWDRRKSPTDIGPLVGATQVVWSITHPPARAFRSRYEDEDAAVVVFS
ncbi:MAG: terminase [Jatrophihabitantaceae bacterium]